LVKALKDLVDESDVVIATGGTARGHRDHLRSALEALAADVLVDGVAVRPGHPMTLATITETPVVGLPGNPLSALVAMVTLVEPMLDAWNVRNERVLPRVRMAEEVVPSNKPLTRLMVGRRELGGFRQVQYVSSAMLRGIAHADGWAVVPPEGVARGHVVEWIPLPWRRRSSVGP
jgi:molybdopterin molybdotransferase